MKRIAVFVLSVLLLVSMFSVCFADVELDLSKALESGTATRTTITPTVDGQAVKVTWSLAPYAAKPNRPEDQLINIYVPESATKDSPILFLVNNGAWMSDAYAFTIDDTTGNAIKDGVNYRTVLDAKADNSTGREQRNAYALKRGYVIVSYGCRGRGNGLTGDSYLGHSPATMVDTKAAIRYLRKNKDVIAAGDMGKIIVTGRSGGGGLTAVISASGNSPDYFEGLYEIGAAGLTKNETGEFINDPEIGDNVFAGVAYCPITDLGHADGAYEYTYYTTRGRLYKDGNMNYDSAGVTMDEVLANSKALKEDYIAYVNSLGFTKKDGTKLTGANLEEAIIELMKAEVEDARAEFGVEKMREDIENSKWHGNTWLTFNDDGSFTYDYAEHLYFVAMNEKLKIAPAFSNMGMNYTGERNEDNLFGTRTDVYSPFEFLSWNKDVVKNAAGKDDTGLDWDEYMKTDAGKALALAIKMTSPMQYLSDEKNDGVAPNWYVRWGVRDRDSSFAVETVLYYGLLNCKSVKNLDFEFAWLEGHAGDYDIPEMFTWLDTITK